MESHGISLKVYEKILEKTVYIIAKNYLTGISAFFVSPK
jgi:hypothetical protein